MGMLKMPILNSHQHAEGLDHVNHWLTLDQMLAAAVMFVLAHTSSAEAKIGLVPFVAKMGALAKRRVILSAGANHLWGRRSAIQTWQSWSQAFRQLLLRLLPSQVVE